MNFGCGDDDSFGPAVRGCRGDFDFTIRFEQLVLAIIPPAVFVALVVPRVVSLSRKPLLVKGTALLASKVVAMVSLAALQIGLLALATRPGRFKTLLTASSSLALASSACMLLVSWLEHVRSPRPSILLAGYLFLSILFDAAMLRTFWLARSPSSTASTAGAETTFCRLFSATLAIKTAILCLESVHKTRYIRSSAAWWQSVAHSPEETSGLFGLGAYAWLSSLFLKGYRNVMVLDDLFALDPAMSSKKLESKLVASTSTSTPGRTYDFGRKKNGLLKALVRALAVDLLLPVAPRLALAGFLFGQPFLINATLAYLDDPTAPKNHSYGLIGATFLIYIGISVSTAVHYYYQERVLFMVRGALAAAVYRKTTELPLTEAPTDDASDEQSTPSASLTLMSTDVERIRTGFLRIHEYWANTMQIAVACWLLMRTLGSAGAFAAPLAVILLAVGVMSSVAVLTGKRQRAWMAVIQQRVAMTSNAIAHMKQLKMLGLAVPVETLIQNLRVHELQVGAQFRMVLCIAVAVAYTPQMFAPVFAFVFSFAGSASLEPTQTAEIFTALSLIVLVALPFVSILQGVPSILAALACLGRVQDFLEKDPRDDFRQEAAASLTENGENADNAAATIDAAHIGWGTDKFHMSDVHLEIPAGKLTVVVGPIASGKSTLCKVLLGEVPFYQTKAGAVGGGGGGGGGGSVLHVKHGLLPSSGQCIGYCDQEPFLFNATVRENIIGIVAPDDIADNAQPTPPFDEARYHEAIEAAMLLSDLAQLPHGDRTQVGSNGITLSGGQRQRVSIARALYGGAAAEGLYIFDDVLSGLDADTEEQVFGRVFGPLGLLRKRAGATTVLCTHSVRHLPAADHVVALDVQGRIVEQGTFEDLMANRKYIHSLGVTAKKTSSSPEPIADKIAPVVVPPNKDTSIFQARVDPENPENPSTAEEQKQQANRARGDTAVYRHYFSRIGVVPLVGFVVLGVGFGFLNNWGTIWIKFWVADAGSGDPSTQHHSTGFYLGMYGLFQALGLVCLFSAAVIVFRTMIQLSGAKMHREALQTVVRAPLRFFTTTDNGVITNLFSQDITLIDGDLPQSFANFGIDCFSVLCMAAVIATSSPYLVILYPFLLGVFWVLQRFYLRTSRQLRLLDLEAKSPLYTHFIDTIKGLATYRAYGWATRPRLAGTESTASTANTAQRVASTSEKSSGVVVKDCVAVAVNDQLLDRSQRPAYLLAMIQQGLTFSLNVLVALMATIVVALATLVRSGGGSHTAFTGASLVLLMSFGEDVGHIMNSYTQLETSIGAVSRLKTFSETVQGEGHDDGEVMRDLPPHWPTGHVTLENVSASYSGEGGKVLDNVSLDICAGDKVAICGRTGSGKSSTILLLLRLLNPLEGSSIVIDGIPLASVDRVSLRERIIAVPQDAVFLPDGTTFRQNLDPFGGFATTTTTTTFTPEHSAMCQAVLEKVDLWTFVQERGGLDAGMVADTLSQGQRQLFSLGRAIFRRRSAALAAADSGILLVDELSSSVDVTTDRAMQSLIQSEFASYTIIMVSHRLDMVLATCNRVVVLDQGRVVETGEPSALVNTAGTRFHELWLLGGGH